MSGGGEAMLYPYRPAGEHRLPGLRPGGAAGPGALLGLMRDVGQLFDCEPTVLQRPDSPVLLLFYPDTVFQWRDLAEVCGGALAGLAGVSIDTTSTRVYNTPYAAHVLGRVTGIYSGEEDYYQDLGYSLDAKVGRGGVELLLGAGISAAAIRRIRESLPQARAFHMSGKITVESPMSYRKGDVSMGLPGFDEYTLWRTDPENLRAARKELME